MVASLDRSLVLKSPYPWFGGKSRAAHLIWQGLGDPINFVEPFFGSGAVLLNRPDYNPLRHTETINDLDCFVANFWRAAQADPAAVAHWADAPVNEADLQARHRWLVAQTFRSRLMSDPDYFDAKIAGWWVWGVSAWIGSGWCAAPAPKPHLPHLGDGGQGIHRKLPHLGDGGQGIHRKSESDLPAYFEALAARLRKVRVACGDWTRVLGKATTESHGMTGILLDPPYDQSLRSQVYSVETNVSAAVRQWAIEHGDNPKLRIALCGYATEHAMPDTWQCVEWKAGRGYAKNTNRIQERIWFSPHCLPVEP